jgi:hypothetical protein
MWTIDHQFIPFSSPRVFHFQTAPPLHCSILTDTFAQLCNTLADALPTMSRMTFEHVQMHLHMAPEDDTVLHGLTMLQQPTIDVHITLGELLHPQIEDTTAGNPMTHALPDRAP